MDDINFKNKINFIYEKTKKYSHNGKLFFDHLINTSNIIKELFPKEQYLIDAGLFHSIYGTCYYNFDQKIKRFEVRSLIGEEAENLVYIFCSLSNRTLKIINNNFDPKIQRDLCILEYANYLEQNGDEKIISELENILNKKFFIKLKNLTNKKRKFIYF